MAHNNFPKRVRKKGVRLNVDRSNSLKGPWGELACDICEQAIRDMKRIIKKKEWSLHDERQYNELTSFFLDGWFEDLSGFDGREVLYLITKGSDAHEGHILGR